MRDRVGAALTALLLATAAHAAEPSLSVKYRSAANVYLDGGRAAGLAVGDRLAVMSGSTTVAELEVIFLADLSASCRIVSESRAVRAGDVAVRIKKGQSPAAAEAPPPKPEAPAVVSLTPPSPARKPAGRPFARVRGGLALGYYRFWDETPAGFDFEQRTARVDVSAWDLGGQPFTLAARLRSRQDIRARTLSLQTPKDQRKDRLYELSLRYEPVSDRFVFELGRISSSRFLSVAYLDGALGRVRLVPRLQVGGFFGKRADVDGLGFEGSGQKYGGFLRLAPNGRYSMSSYEVIVAAVREFASHDISREYVSVESQFGRGGRWSVFERAEVDLNRGWRRTLADKGYQLSNVSVSANLRFSNAASMALSYDNLKNYRTFLNRSVPENEFERLLHQGLRGSLYLGQPYGINVSANAGVVFKGKDPQNSYSYGGGIRHGNLFGRTLSFGVDGAGYSNAYTEGYLLMAQAGKRFGRGHQLDLGYGNARYRVRATGQSRMSQWLRFTGRVEIVGGLALLSDVQYDEGDDVKGPRGFFELGYRF